MIVLETLLEILLVTELEAKVILLGTLLEILRVMRLVTELVKTIPKMLNLFPFHKVHLRL